jgi:hypothetical protein
LERGKCSRELKQREASIKDLKMAIEKLQKPGTNKKILALAHNEFGFSYYDNAQFEEVTYYKRGHRPI